MTKLLEEAFSRARELPETEQDALAARIIAELDEDDDFDRCIAATVHKLDWLIEEAEADYRAGRTLECLPPRKQQNSANLWNEKEFAREKR